MTISIELPPEVEARFVAEAQRKGVPVGEIVKAYLVQSGYPAPEVVPIRLEEQEKALDALFDSLSATTGIQEGAFHRENWYR